MDIKDYDILANRCIAADAPRCSDLCPLGVDIPEMLKYIAKGRMDTAYRTFIKEAVFPGICVHLCEGRCQKGCFRSGCDDPLRVPDLEKYIWEAQRNKKRRSYRIPEKEGRIAVAGGGLTGLTCALRLARRGFHVTVFEKNERLGGRLLEIPEEILPDEVIESDLGSLYQIKTLEIRTGNEVDLPETLMSDENAPEDRFDAVFVATGEAADDPAGDHAEGVLYAPVSQEEDSPLQAVFNGTACSYELESYLTIGRMYSDFHRRPYSGFEEDPDKVAPVPAVSRSFSDWTPEDAKAEAARCIQCHCSACSDSCEMLRECGSAPSKLIRDIRGTVYKDTLGLRGALSPILSCRECGLCKEVCPADIDFGAIIFEARRLLNQLDLLPEGYYNYWLRMMEESTEETPVFLSSCEDPEYLFFPGCQLGAHDNRYVTDVYEWLCTHTRGAALFATCCGAPAYWSGREDQLKQKRDEIVECWKGCGSPVVVLACPSCRRIFSETMPEIETISLWELMAAKDVELSIDEKVVSVFDPCASRNDTSAQEAVRQLIRNSGAEIRELPYSGSSARCCGTGGLTDQTNPELLAETSKINSGMGDRTFITYCVNCKDSLNKESENALHILDLFVGNRRTKPVDISERQRNRQMLFEKMTGRTIDKKENMLVISDEIRQKMERLMITEQDISRVIDKTFKKGSYMMDADTGDCICYAENGSITVWLYFSAEQREGCDIFTIKDIYYHRMTILG